MSNYIKIAFIACACIAVAVAQFGYYGDFSDGYLGTSFGASGFQNTLRAAAVRDSRSNTGPVVFPPSPPGDPSQTSGVVVGASGFGFVPPGSQGSAATRFYYPAFYLRR
ncbi:uncharacterized protein LOC113227001 [Hyposmocoma kahamanoa]|uniref:uncharacterized protein LOC113227001 n=1 Tax=Hyposmocoma kahamanoa TaxID=1477025 RepID=UPI000E6D6468|nr:uncharacterized protein LOC113227001 [Hyposmocoma kahamanoa]